MTNTYAKAKCDTKFPIYIVIHKTTRRNSTGDTQPKKESVCAETVPQYGRSYKFNASAFAINRVLY